MTNPVTVYPPDEITTTEIGTIGAAEIAAMVPEAVAALTNTQIAQLTTTQVGLLATTQLAALTTTQVGAILTNATTTQIAGLTSTNINALVAGYAITTTQIAGLTSTHVAVLTPAVVAALTDTQIAQLTTTQIAGLSSTAVAALHTIISTNLTHDDLEPGFRESAFHSWSGSVVESISAVVTSNGSVVTLTVQADPTGDLTALFTPGPLTIDCTPALTATLTPGTDASPQMNYAYILEGAPTVITVSTAGFPTTGTYVPIGTYYVQSAATVATYGTLKNHAWTDHIDAVNNNGHISHLNKWIRHQPATWISGCAVTPTLTTGTTPDTLTIAVATGKALQFHEHTTPTFDSSGGGTTNLTTFFCANHLTPNTVGKDLCSAAFLQDTAGNAVTLTNKRISFVVWAAIAQADSDFKVFVNLPTGFYTTDSAAIADDSKFTDYSIPSAYRGVGFLLAKLTYHVTNSTPGSYALTLVEQLDLRGQFPSTAAGGSAAADHENLSGLLGGSTAGHWHLTEQQVTDLSSLTTTQVASLGTTQMAVLSATAVSGITTTAIGGLTTTQMGALSTTQIAGAGLVRLMTPTQALALTATQIASLQNPVNGRFLRVGVAGLDYLDADLDALSDVVITAVYQGDHLQYDGSVFRNVPVTPVADSGGAALQTLFYSSPAVEADDANNDIPINTLKTSPVLTGALTVSKSIPGETAYPVSVCAWLSDSAIGVTTIPSQKWTHALWSASSAPALLAVPYRSMFEAIIEGMNVTTTGTGTSRTATAASGSPFVSGDANADGSQSGYVQTPQGLYPITAYTSPTVVTITTPSGYTNETGVAWKKWKFLFVSTPAVSSFGPTPVLIQSKWDSVQPAFTVVATSFLSSIDFVSKLDAGSVTVEIGYDGVADISQHSCVYVPLSAFASGSGGGGALTTTQIAGLGTTEMAYLTATAVSGLTTTALQSVTSTQIAAIPTSAIAGRTAAQVAAIPTTAVTGITTTQIVALTTTQLTALSDIVRPYLLKPNVTGGTIIGPVGGYMYARFLADGTIKPIFGDITVDIVSVGGGGSGGANGGGGGGAGGLLLFSGVTLTNNTEYLIDIGAGGPLPTPGIATYGITGSPTNFGPSGNPTWKQTLGGGGGGYTSGVPAYFNGIAGGSGGGGGGYGTTTGGAASTPTQGFAGGNGVSPYSHGAGGGGAGEVGDSPSGTNVPVAGGDGVNTYSAWATATSTGDSGYFAGGGAGSNELSATAGIPQGGLGGGGDGRDRNTNATNGAANTGGGGGGGGYVGGPGSSGSGGSGILLIRWPV